MLFPAYSAAAGTGTRGKACQQRPHTQGNLIVVRRSALITASHVTSSLDFKYVNVTHVDSVVCIIVDHVLFPVDDKCRKSRSQHTFI